MRPLISFVLGLVATCGCGPRALPPYVSHGAPELAVAGSAGFDEEVPPPPAGRSLDFSGIRRVGVRFEYAGEERGPNGATQPFAVGAFEVAHPIFFRALERELRDRSAHVGPATGQDELEVRIVLRHFQVEHLHCVTTRGVFCERGESCSDTECDRPVRLRAELHARLGDVSGRTLSVTRQSDGDFGLRSAVDNLYEQLAQETARFLVQGGLR